MKTLITPAQVIALAFADGEYLPPQSVTEADIAAAEQRHLAPIVGTALYEKLLLGGYAAFAEEYLAPAIALCTRLSIQPRLDIRTGGCGTVAPRSSAYQPASEATLARLQKSLRTQAQTLLRRASDHLDAHSDEFPEYNPRANILKRCSTDGNLVQIR